MAHKGDLAKGASACGHHRKHCGVRPCGRLHPCAATNKQDTFPEGGALRWLDIEHKKGRPQMQPAPSTLFKITF